jgi:hypothetical protein
VTRLDGFKTEPTMRLGIARVRSTTAWSVPGRQRIGFTTRRDAPIGARDRESAPHSASSSGQGPRPATPTGAQGSTLALREANRSHPVAV